MMGGTIIVSAAQAVFANRLLAALPTYAADIDAGTVLGIGASELKNVFSGDSLAGVLESYMVGLKATFLFGTALAGSAFIASWVAPIKSIKQGRSSTNTDT